MGTFIEEWNKELGTEKMPLTEFLVQYLYREGYMELEEYIKYLNNNTYIPYLSLVQVSESNLFEDKIKRQEIINNKDNLVKINIDFFA